MITSATEILNARATAVRVSEDTLAVDLADGRTIAVPLAWFPRLLHGTAEERSQYEIVASGDAIRWAALDEDIGTASLLAGRRSGETAASLERWLAARRKSAQTPPGEDAQ